MVFLPNLEVGIKYGKTIEHWAVVAVVAVYIRATVREKLELSSLPEMQIVWYQHNKDTLFNLYFTDP